MLASVNLTAETAARVLEFAGIAVICGGVVYASAIALWRIWSRRTDVFTAYRQSLARAILLGLEIFVAADIVGTVAVAPSWPNVGVLAVIVLIRTVLSFSLQVEIEGTWPWRVASLRAERERVHSA